MKNLISDFGHYLNLVCRTGLVFFILFVALLATNYVAHAQSPDGWIPWDGINGNGNEFETFSCLDSISPCNSGTLFEDKDMVITLPEYPNCPILVRYADRLCNKPNSTEEKQIWIKKIFIDATRCQGLEQVIDSLRVLSGIPGNQDVLAGFMFQLQDKLFQKISRFKLELIINSAKTDQQNDPAYQQNPSAHPLTDYIPAHYSGNLIEILCPVATEKISYRKVQASCMREVTYQAKIGIRIPVDSLNGVWYHDPITGHEEFIPNDPFNVTGKIFPVPASSVPTKVFVSDNGYVTEYYSCGHVCCNWVIKLCYDAVADSIVVYDRAVTSTSPVNCTALTSNVVIPPRNYTYVSRCYPVCDDPGLYPLGPAIGQGYRKEGLLTK